MSADETLVTEIDRLYEDNSIVESYSLLKPHNDDPVCDIQWRLGRAKYKMSKINDNAKEKKALIYEAFEHIKKALELDSNSFAVHKWYAILLESIGSIEGTKQKINNALIIKEHLEKASQLKPDDATLSHMIGVWCFSVADISWYERKIAAVIFGTPPTSSYEEALQHFEKAETIQPNFYSKNLVMLGKTNLRMKNKEKAKEYLTRAHEYPVKTEDDKEAHKEAEDLLKSV